MSIKDRTVYILWGIERFTKKKQLIMPFLTPDGAQRAKAELEKGVEESEFSALEIEELEGMDIFF